MGGPSFTPPIHFRVVTEQSTVVPRMVEYGASYLSASAATTMSTPTWVNRTTTIRFLLALGSARIPGECQFLTLSTDAQVVVELDDAIGSALPELCFVLPSGDMVDFIEYNDNIPLPEERPSDDWAGMHATVRIQLLDELDVTNVQLGSTLSASARKRTRS